MLPTQEEREGVEWAERHALENIKGRFVTAEMIGKEANTTFTLLLAGVGGGLAYVVKLLDAGHMDWLFASVAAATGYMLLLAVWLVVGCLMIKPIPAIYQHPKNIEYGEKNYWAIRRGDLRRLEADIVVAAERNDQLAVRLNRLRLSAVLTPAVFTVVAVVGYGLDRAGLG